MLTLLGNLIGVLMRFVDWISGQRTDRRQLLKQVADAEDAVFAAQQQAAAGMPDGLRQLHQARASLEVLRRKAGLLAVLAVLLLAGCRQIPPPMILDTCERTVVSPLLLPHLAPLIPDVATGDVVLSEACYLQFIQTEADYIRLLARDRH